DFPSRTPRFHLSDRAPTPHRDDYGQASADRPEPAMLAQQTRRRNSSTRQAPDLTLTFLTLEGGPMSQERSFGNSGAEHHPHPTDEATIDPQVTEARAASPTPTPARSQSRPYNPIQIEPDFDTLSIDTADSLREQVRRVHQRLDEVQK
ncbi:hypothetical protein BHM03_00060979, partial [Ensete ventricosum]